jgi:hypothetical protein
VAEEPGVACEIDADTLAFAHRMFDLAHAGATEEPAGYVAAGLKDRRAG